ncbi:peptidoglycan-binding domain-containing protein [Oceanimonas marisflavi]|uniref:peptidoglycan-binding domain-containing protein n=1 Tax=Oceanimonas marisflavi TaxID=2059724 RepID=UPI00130024B8|nr:peptidoglycan-binding domain-containing protein [Oceanimonas marisflavi]
MKAVNHSLFCCVLIRTFILLAFIFSVPATAAERNVASFGDMQATTDAENWCGTTINVKISAPSRTSLTASDRDLQLLAGGVRKILSFECPQLQVLRLTGYINGSIVARWMQYADGKFKSIELAADSTPPYSDSASSVSPQLTKRQKIKEAQQLLARLGYQPGPADGIMGSRTRNAIRDFLRDNDMPQTREVNDNLLASLRYSNEHDSSTDVATSVVNTPPAIKISKALPKKLPVREGRLLAKGRGVYRELVPDLASEWLGKAGLLMALKLEPSLLDKDSRAFGYFQLLDEMEQEQVSRRAGVSPNKVIGKDLVSYGGRGLDEFERRALLKIIREEVPAMLSARTPLLPLPIFLVCHTAFKEYDFNKEVFPMHSASSFCNAVHLGRSGRVDATLDDITISAPLPLYRLPDEIPVPVKEAKGYKKTYLEYTPPARRHYDPASFGVEDRYIYGVEAMLTGIKALPASRRGKSYRFEVSVEGVQLFRPDSNLSASFLRLEPLPLPSLETVSATPGGEVYADNPDTLGLLLLANEQLDLVGNGIRQWIRGRMHEEAIQRERVKRGEPPTPWAAFFPPDLTLALRDRDAVVPSWLITNFSEWTRARAAALPDTLWIETHHASRGYLTGKENGSQVFVFAKPGTSNVKKYEEFSRRLQVSEDRLVIPRRWGKGQVFGLDEEVELVLVLPEPRDTYTLVLAPKTTEKEDFLTLAASLEVGSIRLERASSGTPLIVIEAVPRSAKAFVKTVGQQRQSLASITFEVMPTEPVSSGPAVVKPAKTDSPQPFSAEVADLLQLKYLPDTVDDAMLRRMMLSRFSYEKAAPAPVPGGRFFTDFSQPPAPAQLTERLAEFKAWSMKRIAQLPERFTVRLRFDNGVAQNEVYGNQSHRITCDQARRSKERGEALTESLSMQLRLCDFLDAAWSRSDSVLWLRNLQYSPDFIANRGNGPRAECNGYEDPYCRAIGQALKQGAGNKAIYYRDLLRIDRLPVLKAEHRKVSSGLVLEIELQPTGAKVPEVWPDTSWNEALREAQPFAQRFGLQLSIPPKPVSNPSHTLLFEASTLAARLVERDTGEVHAELELVRPLPLPVALLSAPVPESNQALDILGIDLGMSFDDAEKLIRKHMKVGRILVADRVHQTTTLAGKLEPYSSGRMYVSEDEQEMITLFDEPPAASDKVVAIRRQMRFSPKSLNLIEIKSSLEQRYGAPVFSRPTNNFGRSGLDFIWAEHQPTQSCQGITVRNESFWLDGDKQANPPSSIGQHRYPDIATSHFRFIGSDDEISQMYGQQSFCPLMLGASIAQPLNPVTPTRQTRYSNPTQDHDEIVIWLHDQRRYAKLFSESYERSDELLSEASSEGEEASSIAF